MAIKPIYKLLLIYFNFCKNTQSKNIYCKIVGWLVPKELEWIWMEVIVV